MKRILLSLLVVLLGVSFVALDAQARRLGGGSTSGMQRQMPAKPAPTSPPAQQQQAPAAAPGAAGNTAAAPAPAPKRSWLGPIAGLAAGLGLAALMSHLGLGEEFGNFLLIALLVMAAVIVVRLLLRRFAPPAQAPSGMQYAGAGAALGSGVQAPAGAFGSSPAAASSADATAAPALPVASTLRVSSASPS